MTMDNHNYIEYVETVYSSEPEIVPPNTKNVRYLSPNDIIWAPLEDIPSFHGKIPSYTYPSTYYKGGCSQMYELGELHESIHLTYEGCPVDILKCVTKEF